MKSVYIVLPAVVVAALLVPMAVAGFTDVSQETPGPLSAQGAEGTAAGMGQDAAESGPSVHPSDGQAIAHQEADPGDNNATEAASPSLRTDEELDEILARREEVIYSRHDPDFVFPPAGSTVATRAVPPTSPLSHAMAAHLDGFGLIHEVAADDPTEYSSSTFDHPDGGRVHADYFGREFVDRDATLRSEPASQTGRWEGIGDYAVPSYGVVGSRGRTQILVGFDDGSLLNITWERGGTGLGADEGLRLTRQVAEALVAGGG